MSDPTSDDWRIALATLLPRRGLWRVLGGALGLSGLTLLSGEEGAAKKKKKKKKKKTLVVLRCAGKVCNAGFVCDEADGTCKCGSAVTCAGGGVCCTANQVCDAAQTCCTPQPPGTTCQGKCGTVDNNCDQPVNCGGCADGLVCSSANDGVCQCETGGATCEGRTVCCDLGDVCAAATDTCSPAYQFVSQWGGLSECVQPDCSVPEFNGKFNKPTDLDFDADDNVYVVDWDNERIQKFTSAGAFITRFGETGFEEDQFSAPYGIEVAANGIVHVADYAHNRVQRWKQNDDNELQYDFVNNWGAFGADAGEFSQPLFIAQDSAGAFYISDSLNHRVQKFDSTGASLLSFGELGTANGKFNQPYGVAVDSDDNVFVVDYGNHRVQKFSSLGVHVTTWGSFGDLPGKFVLPQGIAVDSFDDVFVADTNNHRIQKFTQDSVNPLQYNWVTTLGTTGTFGDDPGEFRAPAGVGVDSEDMLYVADTANHRIQKFAPVPDSSSLRVAGGGDDKGQGRSSRRARSQDRDRERGKHGRDRKRGKNRRGRSR